MTQDEQDRILIRTQTLVEEIHRSVFGNGQPGLIQKMESFNNWKNRIRGAIGVLWGILTLVGGSLLVHLWKGSK